MKPSEGSSLTRRDERRLDYSDVVLVTSFIFSFLLFLALISTPIYYHLFIPTREQKMQDQLEKLGIEYCTEGACMNGGNCSANLELNFTCACPPLFKGRKCQLAKNAEVEVDTTSGVEVKGVWLGGKVMGHNLLKNNHYYFPLRENTRCVALHLYNNVTKNREAGFKVRIKYNEAPFEDIWKCSTREVADWKECSTDLSAWTLAFKKNFGWWLGGEKEVFCRTEVSN